MSHSWIGAPAVFNGTDDVTGGDSGECETSMHTTANYARAVANTRGSRNMRAARREIENQAY